MTVEEFNQCVDLHADALYRFILKNLKDPDKARDIVQDTYEKLWNRVSETASSNAKSYMFTTAYRTMIDVIRRDRKQGSLDEAEMESLGHSGQYTGLQEALHQALERIPPVQRSAIMLRDYEGYTYEEIGNILSLSESQVKVYIFRARKALREYIVHIENLV